MSKGRPDQCRRADPAALALNVAAQICASVNFDAFMELSSSQHGIIIRKFQLRLA